MASGFVPASVPGAVAGHAFGLYNDERGIIPAQKAYNRAAWQPDTPQGDANAQYYLNQAANTIDASSDKQYTESPIERLRQ